MIDLEDKFIRPLALNCLAYPTGLALSTDQKTLYIHRRCDYTYAKGCFFLLKYKRFVCETCKNRVLRFVLTP